MLTARESLAALLDPEVAKLVLIVVAGRVLFVSGGAGTARIEFAAPLQFVYEGLLSLTALAGFALSAVGTLALLVKLVHDAVVLAGRR